MSFDPSSPLTGGAQSGFTSPTYTLTSDIAPGSNGEQWAITALGGTQTGVDTHTVSKPFTLSVFKPANFKTLPLANPVTGQVSSVPRNVYKVITRKGVTPLSGQADVVMLVETVIHVPAGADTADSENVLAALSCHIGALSDTSSGLGDTSTTGVL